MNFWTPSLYEPTLMKMPWPRNGRPWGVGEDLKQMMGSESMSNPDTSLMW